jgi:hypothetical protein
MTSMRLWQNVEMYSGEWRLCLACNRWVSRGRVAALFE